MPVNTHYPGRQIEHRELISITHFYIGALYYQLQRFALFVPIFCLLIEQLIFM